MSSISRIIGDIMAAGIERAVATAGPHLQRSLMRACLVFAIVLAAVAFLVGAAGIALGGTYLLLAPEVGAAGAAFLCAALSVAAGLVMILWAKSKVGEQ
jgi:hypothetical protein